ncbi:lantibiotic dehydratase [Streptomyces sp. JJ38]|uniref:lantibiotic dehydratase n=1 Tax=Streptomyces sp. JJ38 TaxID=2738128 RepID=UPI001C585C65|nr:lantibiotic dehydratase [Streptomyces sp. JJ38]MBW1598374.1 hypothetical protein [Streptomyces sp. JJ38]
MVRLSEDWALWPVAMLRSAGLPVTRLLEFIKAAEEAGRDVDKLCALLEDVSADPWLLEALSWQNPTIVNSWLLRYGVEGVGPARRKPARYRDKLLALGAYVQRYATKNETVGFYGPSGWAEIDPTVDTTARAEGTGTRVGHYEEFEPWAIAALTESWTADPEVRWYLPVIESEVGVLDGDFFLRPRRRPLRLTPDQKSVLEGLATGPDHATELLEVLRESSGDGEPWTRERLEPVLRQLHKADCLWWGFELPNERGLEAHVMAQLSRFPEGELRSRLTASLRKLQLLRDEVSVVLGDAGKTIEAMNRLGEAFEEATGHERRVLKEVDPDSRTLLYHDVAVDWDAVVGARAVAELSGPLELLMAVSRYVTWKVAEEIDGLAREALAEGDHSFEAVFDELAPVLAPDGSSVLSRRVMADVHAKVQRVLEESEPRESTAAAVTYRTQALRERWLEVFATPRYGWSAARLHSPDFMLASDGERHTWVLGELHMAANPLDYRFCLDTQPRPGRIEELIEASTSERYIPAFPAYWPRKTPRTAPPPAHYIADKQKYWTLWSRSVVAHAIPKLSCVGMTVADRDGEVLVVDATGEPLARLCDFIGEFLSLAFASTFSLSPKGEHQRRLSLDDVVVQRRTWQFPVRQLPPAAGKGASLRKLFESRGVPRYTFVRVPGELKPVFCDAHSSMMVDGIIRLLRKVSDPDALVQVQEMIPDVEHLWLRGADGNPVTSEFRFVVQDMRASE